MKTMFVSFIIASAIGCCGAYASSTNPQPSQQPVDGNAAVAAPTVTNADATPLDAAARADLQAWQASLASLDSALIASDRPRDWALAGLNYIVIGPDPVSQPVRDELVQRALRKAPDDIVVHWLVANSAGGKSDAPAKLASIAALKRLEPDNAAAWVLTLSQAAKRNDTNEVDAALAHMAGATRFDAHYFDVMHAWLDVYTRYPPPPPKTQSAPDPHDPNFDMPLIAATARAGATALPALQALTIECKPAGSVPIDFTRRHDCAEIGRLMLHHSSTVMSRMIGFVVLRNLGDDVLTAEEREARRNLDWYEWNLMKITASPENHASGLKQFDDDMRTLDDETETIKRALQREGVAAEAPAGWTLPTDPKAYPKAD